MKEYSVEELCRKAKDLFQNERKKTRLDGWFLTVEESLALERKYADLGEEMKKAKILCDAAASIPLEITENHVFAGTQDDAFARTYALINPLFKVENFCGYCDPTAVFGDIVPNEELTEERIGAAKTQYEKTPYVSSLSRVYGDCEKYTKEVVYFVEQVTGHLIPDFRFALKHGVREMQRRLAEREGEGFRAFAQSLEAVVILAERYAELAEKQAETADSVRRAQLEKMAKTLRKVPAEGCDDLYEAIQSYILLWQVMCVEQAPNPYAFSVGNADRIFEPYRKETSREEAAALFRHFLVFFNVADRSWAISQDLIIGGRDLAGRDLTNETSYALLDAYYDMNLPQPILSVKLHKNTPDRLYREMGRFFFGAGVLTPSLFNDDSLFELLRARGVAEEDLPDIAIAGCQEPLIMGKDNGNTTNSWLNLPKVLEMTLTGGFSTVTGEKLADVPPADLKNLKEAFFGNLQFFADRMAESANGCSRALSNLRVPFLSSFMGGCETGIDVRDTERQGTVYNGSGCLIHGVSVVADSLVAVERLLKERPEDADRLVDALRNNFEGYEELREFLLKCPKFGNNLPEVDLVAAEIMARTADMVAAEKNYLGNPFRPDFSSPSTHLLYGYWVGATPDGRKARDMVNYGVDPLYGMAENGLGFRTLSAFQLDYAKCTGGYASHLGVNPAHYHGKTPEDKGMEFKNQVIAPLFFNPMKEGMSPFYLYVNVTTPEILRKVLANPKVYAPSGVYIMRIHGTFVNFLDLSPAIQQDIITRLDLQSAG